MSNKRRREKAPPVADDSADRAALALWLTLLLLATARAALTFTAGTWVWSLNLNRFLSSFAGWGLWLIAALALVPPLARRASPMCERWGDALSRRPTAAATAWALGAATLAWFMPDRVRFVGDFLLRQGTVEIADRPGVLFPQALPLDVLLHYALPLKLTAAHLMSANSAARLLGAAEAAMLGALAATFARTLDLRGGAALACAAVVFFGGYLGMFTGFSKAFAEMCVLMGVVGVSGVTALRTGRGLLACGLAVAIGITLHRSALGMLPAWALVCGLWLARHGAGGAWRHPGVLAAVAPPLLALAVMAPRIAGTVLHTDTAVHFAPPDVQAQGGVLAAALAGTRPLDLLSLGFMLSPLAIAIPLLARLLAPALARRPGRGSEAFVLTALALPFVGVMVFIHPAQGLFRDWDDFAATGVALSLLAAWLVGEALRDARRFAWLAVAVTLGVAVPAIQWLIVHNDTDRGLARVRAFVLEPPLRPAPQRGTTWDYLGIHSYSLNRFADAQLAFARAAETSPSPRILEEWALAATMSDDLRTAQRAYRLLLAKDSENNQAWLGLVAVSMRLRDVPEAKRAAIELLRRDPTNTEAQRALDEIARFEVQQADSVRRATGR
jgi:hypothetical protein